MKPSELAPMCSNCEGAIGPGEVHVQKDGHCFIYGDPPEDDE